MIARVLWFSNSNKPSIPRTATSNTFRLPYISMLLESIGETLECYVVAELHSEAVRGPIDP